MFPALGEDGPAELEALVLVELALVQEDAKVLQQGRRLTGLGGHLNQLKKFNYFTSKIKLKLL